jgi:RNA recognition motif-containing protein
MNIFVAKLSFSTVEASVREAFEVYGTVDTVKLIMDKETGRSKGYAFVEMGNDQEATEAINALDNTDLDGNTIVVKKAVPKEQSGGGFNRGGGGGNRFNRGGGGGGGFNRDNNRGGGGGGYNRDSNRGGGEDRRNRY